MMFAVGVDVSNGKSTIAVLETKTKVVFKPFDVAHTSQGMAALVDKLNCLEGEKRIVMEHTGRYYESVAMYLDNAGFFVCALNPLILREYQDGITVRNVKTDKADAMKIARFTLDNWDLLRQYTPMDTIRYQLKTLNLSVVEQDQNCLYQQSDRLVGTELSRCAHPLHQSCSSGWKSEVGGFRRHFLACGLCAGSQFERFHRALPQMV